MKYLHTLCYWDKQCGGFAALLEITMSNVFSIECLCFLKLVFIQLCWIIF
jgi:hypothetical protein